MRRALVGLILLGLLAAGFALAQRVRLEAGYRTVEIVLDGDDWMTLIRREGREPAQILAELRARGAHSVALSENTLRRMADEGLIGYAGGGSLAAQARVVELKGPFGRLAEAGGVRPDALYISGPSPILERVAGRLEVLLGPSRVRRTDGAVEVLGTQTDLEEMGLGFWPGDAALFRSAGLDLVLRPRNYRGLTGDRLRVLVDSYAQATTEPTLVFAFTEVQGYEALLPEAAAEYRRVGARYGRIEVFAARRKQRGEDRLTALVRPSVIRVFSVTPEELQTLRPEDVADRFVRAAQERSIRLLYVRPLLSTPAGVASIDVNIRLVESVAGSLRRFGFATGRSRPLNPVEVPRPVTWLVMVGAAALSALVLYDAADAVGIRIPGPVVWGVVLALVLGGIATSLTRLDGLGRQLLALAASVAGATGATVWAVLRIPHPAPPVLSGYATLGRAAAVAGATGLLVAALLSQWAFMLAFSTFLGVKVAHVVPVLLAAAWLALGGGARAGWRETSREVASWLGQPLRLGAAMAVLGLGLAAVMLLARTGNVSLPILGVERQVRTALEDLLVARPRTKEFLVGYPALVLAGAAAAVGWRRAVPLLAAAGTIGTAGAINSFSHLHTPLLYTIWRTGNALLLGALLAIPAVVVLLWIHRRLRPS